MDLHFSVGMLAVFVTAIINTIVVIYNAGKMSGLINHLHECIHRLDDEMKLKSISINRAHERIDQVLTKN